MKESLNPYYKNATTHPIQYRPVNPAECAHSDLAPVVAGVIVAAIGAAASTAGVIISSQSAKKQQERQRQAQEELTRLQAEAALAIAQQRAAANKQYLIYAIIAIVLLGVMYFIFKR